MSHWREGYWPDGYWTLGFWREVASGAVFIKARDAFKRAAAAGYAAVGAPPEFFFKGNDGKIARISAPEYRRKGQ